MYNDHVIVNNDNESYLDGIYDEIARSIVDSLSNRFPLDFFHFARLDSDCMLEQYEYLIINESGFNLNLQEYMNDAHEHGDDYAFDKLLRKVRNYLLENE